MYIYIYIYIYTIHTTITHTHETHSQDMHLFKQYAAYFFFPKNTGHFWDVQGIMCGVIGSSAYVWCAYIW